jgi:hypothetical protein
MTPEGLAALRRSAGSQSATSFLAFLAAIAVAWHKTSGQDSAVIHSPCENRQAPGAERLVGWLAHSLILRLPLGGVRTWHDALRTARRVAIAAFEHQSMPFPQVVRTFQPEMYGTATRQPRLYAAYEPVEDSVQAVPGGRLSRLAVGESAPFADAGVTFRAQEVPEGLRLSTVYDPRTVDAAYIGRLHGVLVSAMNEMSHDLSRTVR